MTKTGEGIRPAPDAMPALGLVSDALDRLRFGSILLPVHDGKVMQIDVTERKRLTA